MTGTRLRAHLVAFALVAPLLAFIVLFFLWPLVAMTTVAVSDPTVPRALPATSAVAGDWDRVSPPPAELQLAFVADLRAVTDQQVLGDVTRRLNSAQAGFRTLMGKTVTAVRATDGPVDLIAVDKRWADPAYWRAVADAAGSVYTDRYLLAAVDLERNTAGDIVAMPEGTSANLSIMVRTFVVAATVTLGCLVVGLPFAMLAAAVDGWRRQLLLAAVLLPLWTSLLVRTAAWFILLQDNGLINATLMAAGITSGPIPLIFNRLGVVIAMVHVLLPFMVLPIFSVLLAIPKNLMPAAASLGAHPVRAFLRVLLPLSLRGIVSGSLLVFMSAIGYYITPALIGGPRDQMISSVIAFYATGSANWGMAGALGLVLLAATLVLYAVYGRLSSDRTARA